MKKYVNPEIEVVEIKETDVISTSLGLGLETPWYDEGDGIWQFGIGL